MPEVKKPAVKPEIKMPSPEEVKKKLAEVDSFLQKLIFKRFIGTFIDMVMITVPAIIITLPAFFCCHRSRSIWLPCSIFSFFSRPVPSC
ncbi:MAG TPA: hypothetical protein PLR50_07360 [Candidatus Rifleibacterium sp.]|nr:hypothetical protein [Candidatus Rifleibacterium sp.]